MSRTNKVLIIEDDPQDAEFTKQALRRMKIAVSYEHVGSLEEFLEYDFKTSPVQLILMDMKLPKVSGLDLIKKIKAKPETQQVHIVVFTSSELPSDIKSAKALGIDEYVVKPIEILNYFSTIEQVCQRWLLNK